MKRDGGYLVRYGQGGCGEGKIPDWFLVLGRESAVIRTKMEVRDERISVGCCCYCCA